MARRVTVKDLRQRNRTAVLRRLILGGPTTRARLAAESDLSGATVSNVVADLIRDGLVCEIGSLPSAGGRPVAWLGVEPSGAYVVGADVGEHGIVAELFDLSLHRVDRVVRRLPSLAVSPGAVAKGLSQALDEILGGRTDVGASLIGIGLGLPGIVEVGTGGSAMLYAQSLGWEPVNIDYVFRRDGVATFADNGAKTLATAESWFGAAYGVSQAVVVLIGRGIGAGIITGGRILRGLSSSAGEWGHTKVSRGGPLCQCGGQGCLEAYAGGGAIVRRWQAAGGGVRAEDEDGLAQLIAAADDGDAVASRVLDETIEILGAGLANLVNLFNPEQIVIGGWAGTRLFRGRAADLSRAVRECSLRRPGEQVRIDPCKLGDDAVALGAALLPLDQLIEGTLPAPKARP